MQASTLRAFRAGHNGGTIKRGIGSRAARVIAKGLSLDKDPRHFGKLGLQLQFELRDSDLDATRRYRVVKVEAQCDEQITRTEMHRQNLVDADDARSLCSDPRDGRPGLRLGGLSSKQALALIGEKRRRNEEDDGNSERGNPIEDGEVEYIGECHARKCSHQPEQRRRVFEQNREDGWILAPARRLEPVSLALSAAELPERDRPRSDLE